MLSGLRMQGHAHLEKTEVETGELTISSFTSNPIKSSWGSNDADKDLDFQLHLIRSKTGFTWSDHVLDL